CGRLSPHTSKEENNMRDKSRACMSHRRAVIIVLTAVLLIALQGNTAVALAEDSDRPSGAGLQAASWLATVPYGAAKVVYAVSGGLVGGLAWVMTGGNTDIAKAIWSPTMTGHYIVQPQNLTGDRPLHFVGGGSSEEGG
ncbi:MAG TPA: hypothetical protein VH332_09395, partial [Nitrospira sp.]